MYLRLTIFQHFLQPMFQACQNHFFFRLAGLIDGFGEEVGDLFGQNQGGLLFW